MATIGAATHTIDSVEFSFMTTEDVEKHSCLKLTNKYLLDTATHTPLRGGLYDPNLGPYSDRESCQRCGQRYANCPGHFGHIDLVLPVYNPLLFNFLSKILKISCLFCFRFKAPHEQVDRFVTQLQLIARGNLVEAKKLDSFAEESSSDPADSDISQETSTTGLSDDCHSEEGNKSWTSIQLAEINGTLRNFFKIQPRKCKHCGRLSPAISKPVVGWFHISGMKGIDLRANIINSHQKIGGVVEELSDEEGDHTEKNNNKKNNSKIQEIPLFKGVSARELVPSEVKEIMEILWENESPFFSFITDIQCCNSSSKNSGASMFFLEALLVTPIKFRPPAMAGDSSKIMDHPQTALYNQVIESNLMLGNAVDNKENSKIVASWLRLQQSVNILFDGKGTGQKDVAFGICQLLEKKEGLFRQKMMGKRVNYACRSVISPDPYLGVNEIGIPPCFAVKLTYPERVTPWNVAKLRGAVINGPDVHHGATHSADKSSVIKLPNMRKMRFSMARKLQSSKGSMQYDTLQGPEYEGKIVYRHVQDGDVVLVNRQPTLHKPSIMAHVVRVLKGEKTLRMHYANCSTYNADFDGDEMNVHLPQDEISRAEAYNIVNANNQFVRPSNGEPLRSLIQDHIISAALLTNRNTFLTKMEFNQLLYSSGVTASKNNSYEKKLGTKLYSFTEDKLQLDGWPAIIKPVPLWTGKQVITAILNHILRGNMPFTVEKTGKISEDFFKEKVNNDELTKKTVHKGVKKDVKINDDSLLIRTNDLVRGVIDKAQFGEFGLVHTVQELYGSDVAGRLLSIFSRLFTAYLQMHGFTCGIDDLLIKKHMDLERNKVFEKCGESGASVHKRFIGLKDDKIDIDPAELQLNIERIIRGDGEAASNFLDRQMSNELNTITSSNVIGRLLSEGLLKPSGKNCISLMTASGAKGSKVNFQQISSLLGQQELEGKRVPRMVSGKTLPCFHPWDWEPRAGGYISDRFLTGLRPQEYYFHCMAGREGLVDTAVKTSRSGYLQRCLIKNMEALVVNYDHTVRDADGSIIQFQYGEDGIDVHKSSFISNLDSLAANRDIILHNLVGIEETVGTYISKLPPRLSEKVERHLESISLGERLSSGFVKHDDCLKLVKHKYFQSLAQPGEPVGVLAAQSVGEPSTQMTLNTFHLAGRGEMNVTLGIPRLQEILMTAANDIKTPIMTCPLVAGSKRETAERLADKLKKISVADITETMEISVIPFAVHNGIPCRIFKLKMKLHRPSHFPKTAKINLKRWHDILNRLFVRELEDAIQSHVVLLSKISGIKDFVSDSLSSPTDDTTASSKRTDDDADDNEDGDSDSVDDLGSDAQKRRLQSADDMDYDDPQANEAENDSSDNDEPSSEAIPQETSDAETDKKKKTKGRAYKKTDREVFWEAKGMKFEVHFKFTGEPHILLGEIAKKTAKKVYIQNPGTIENCRVTNCKESQIIYHGDDPKSRKEISAGERENIPALQAAGVDFTTFWNMQNNLDVRYVYSNNVHAMLNTYGIEAARETIIREVNHVFKSYGIGVSTRHLSLIADYMTHSGTYRPMSRLGGIADCVSPFSKMSFETASKFLVEAALHGHVDTLDTPSARICLGLPVKMGTGFFDVFHNFG